MKNIVITLIFVLIGFISHAQSDFCCIIENTTKDNIENNTFPSNSKYGHIKSYIPYMGDSIAFYNSPVKTIKVNINIGQKDDGSGNFQDTEDTRDRIKRIIHWINQFYSGGGPSDPIEWVEELPSYDSRIRFSIGEEGNERIYFYKNTDFWDPNNGGESFINYVVNNFPERLDAINVYVMGNPDFSINSANADFSSSISFNSNQSVICYYWRYISDWAIANLLGHEFGHSLNLKHTYLGGGASAICDIDDDEFMRDIFMLDTITHECNCPHIVDWGADSYAIIGDRITNNLMGGNNEQKYISPLQAGMIHRSLALTNVRKYAISEKSDIPLVITSQESWDFNIKLYRDLIIESGGTLTLSNHLVMLPDAKIIIKPGGKLIIDGAKITTDIYETKKWQGIEVWGNSFAHQYIINGERQQGYLELKNGATIENAICAVKLFNPSNRQSNGGVIYASDAVLRNNAKAVHAINYTNFNPGNGIEMPYDSHFRNCTFTIDNNYIGEDIFYKHVDIDRVRGIEFLGCSFSVDTNVPQVSESASGIAAYNAGFSVDSYCDSNISPCPDNDLVRSSFTGFHDGIKSINNGGNVYTSVIRNSTFNNNHIGVYIENTSYATILNNIFNVGSSSDCSFGIYANGVIGFTIEENSFVGDNEFSSVNYGVAIKNSNAFNDIYLNSFENLDCGNISIGNNTRTTLSSSSQSGLTYTCNNNIGNLNDFCVVRDANVNGVSRNQGSSASAAGNRFTAVQYHFYNDGDNVINYYHSGGRFEQPVSSKSYRVTAIGTLNSNTCTSHYGGGSNTITRTAEEIDVLQNEYEISLAAFNEMNNIYTSRIDGGNTQAEVLDINTATSNDAMRLRSELLGLSPYLSQEVLTTASRRDDVFSSSVLFEILSANPDELKKDTLISYLENKDNPMPQYMTDLLREMANGSTARTALESQMAKSEREYLIAAGDIVRSNLNSEESDHEQLRTWLANMNDMLSDRLIVASYIQEGDFENAVALAEILPYVYDLQGSELVEHNDYMTLVRLYETLEESGRSIKELSEEETLMVEEIAENGNGNSQMMAYSILSQNDETMSSRATCPTLPSATNSSRGKVDVRSDIAEAMGLSVNLAPNPASSWSEIEYTLPADYNKAELVITNALGINVIKEELVGNYGRTTINLEKLPSGVYTYFIRCGEYVKTGKLIKN